MPKHKNGLIADLLYEVETAVHLTHFFDVNEILLAQTTFFALCFHYEMETVIYF